MSSLTHGWSGLLLAYAAVEVPLAATLIRRGVEVGRVLASAALAAPLTIAAGLGTAAVNPLLHEFGVSRGKFPGNSWRQWRARSDGEQQHRSPRAHSNGAHFPASHEGADYE